jgi:hypothetical protein
MIHQPLHYEIIISSHQLTSNVVSELCANQSLVLNDASEDLNANNKAVNGYHSM